MTHSDGAHSTETVAPLAASAEQATTAQVDIRAVMDSLQSQDPKMFMAATQALEGILKQQPDHAIALLGMGISLARRQQWPQAQTHLERAVAVEPKLASAHSNLGNLHRHFGRRKEALASYKTAVQLQPSMAEAHFNMSVLLDEDSKPEQAEESVRRALLFRANYPEAHNNLGNLLLKAGKVELAVSHFRQALVWNAELRPARFNLIIALYRLGRSVEAQAEVDRLLKNHPDDPQILRVQAAGLVQQGALGDAEAINNKLLALEPDAPDLWLNQGEVLLARRDYEGAMALYKDLLAKRNIPPAVAVGAMASVMLAQGNYSEARHHYQQALMMDGRMPPLLLGLARTLLESGETRQGLETLRRIMEIQPKAANIHSLLIHHMRLDADSTDALIQREIESWLRQHTTEGGAARPVAHATKAGQALHIGFVAGDLEQGPVASNLVALMNLPKDSFDVFIYHTASVGAQAQDLQAHASHWRPMASLGATDMAEQIRQDGIDILIDTIGHGPGSRLKALAQGVAPVQVSWLGDFAETGVPAMDFCLTDSILATPSETTGSDASVPRLDNPLWWPEPKDAPDVSPVPATPFRFGVVSPLASINGMFLDTVASILLKAPQCELHILTDVAPADQATLQRLQRLLALREIEAERITLFPGMEMADHWRRLGDLHVVLDTFPNPLGARALECLWMGVPVLTLTGQAPWKRVSHSLLAQAGLHDWVASSIEEYQSKAVEAASQPAALAPLRADLRQRLLAAPVMDEAAFVRQFESVLRSIWDSALARSTGA